MTTSEKQREYVRRYSKKLRRYSINLNKKDDAELIEIVDNLQKGELNSIVKQLLMQKYGLK